MGRQSSESRYSPLAEHLALLKEPVLEASFQEIESILGGKLPASAYQHRAWWANQTGPGHSQTLGWMPVGWRTAKVDLAGKSVRFEREAKDRTTSVAANDDQLLRRARELTGIQDETMLWREGLQALIAREAAARLVRLGGSMPDFEAPSRERRRG
ncbi:MAG TPA: hypothetical protein VF027_09340 [Sphingomicrobium sp.]